MMDDDPTQRGERETKETLKHKTTQEKLKHQTKPASITDETYPLLITHSHSDFPRSSGAAAT